MRKMIIIALLLSRAHNTFSQTEPNPPMTKEDYLTRSRHQKTAGYILLGAGVTCIAIAASVKGDLGAIVALVPAGTAAMLLSIPQFIRSGRNKRRAERATAGIDREKNFQIQSNSYSFHYYPVLKLRFKL